MVTEGKMVFSLELGASLFKSGKALDISSDPKKSKFKYKLKFREPTDYAGNPFMCGSTACPAMPPMEGEVKIRFPKADDTNKDYGVGPFEGVKVDDGASNDEVNVRDVSKLDSQQDITISASKVSNATDYLLHIYCAGTESSTMYEPPFEWELRLSNAASAPSWSIPRNTIWGGRSCDFRLIAFGEDTVGNPIGSTIYKFTDTLKGGGGGMGGPMMDTNVMIDSSNLFVCYDTSTKSVSSQGSSCSGTHLWTSTLGSTLVLSGGASGSIETHDEVIRLTEGDIDASSSAQTVNVDWVSGTSTPTCGIISNGDYYKDHFECTSDSGTVTLLSMDTSGDISFGTGISYRKGDNLTESWSHGPRKAKLKDTDNNTYKVKIDRWGETGRAFVEVEFAKRSSTAGFTNGQFFELKVGDQPIGFDLRYVNSSEAELGYWLMAEQKTVTDGNFVMDGVTVWSKSGNTITFTDNVSVWDPQKMNTVTSADLGSDGHYNFDITITASSTTYMVWIDVQNGWTVGFEKMQFVASTGGGMADGDMGGGGMGGGNLLSNWVPAEEYICTDGMGFWNQQNTCGSPAVQFLYLNKTNSTLVLGSDFALTKNDDKADDGGGSYAFDNSSSAGIRTITSYQWQDAFYRFKRTSTNQTFDVKTWSADYWDEGSGEAFQGMMIDIMPGADQFSNQTGGDGGQAGASV